MVAERLRFDEVVGPRLTLVEASRSVIEPIQFSAHPTITHGPSPQRRVREQVNAIEEKIERRIQLPNRSLSMEEEQLIAFAHEALAQGEAPLPWNWVTLPVRPEQARKILDDFSGGIVRSLWLSRMEGELFVLFGVVLPLGQTQFLLPQAKLSNEHEVRHRLTRQPVGEESIHLRFAADEITTSIFRYRDWLPDGKYQTRAVSPPRADAPGFKPMIVRDFPSRWGIQISQERRALSDILSVPVLAALEQLDQEERGRVFDAITVLWGWRQAIDPDWSVRSLDGNEEVYLIELPGNVGLIIRQEFRHSQRVTTILEIVRPESLQGNSRDH